MTYLFEFFNAPLMLFSGPVTWKVCRGDICDSLGVDTHNLIIE